jgi:hypothetical protein
MWFEIIFGVYLILFCLGFYTDYSLSIKSNNKYWLFSLPLTAPIIGLKILITKVKVIA